MNCTCCFRFLGSQLKLSSIWSLFELFSEIIRVVSGCTAINKDCLRSGCCLSCTGANCMCCFRFLGSQLKLSSIWSLFELYSEMYLMYCFRFLCIQQRLSSIRSLFDLSSEIISVASGSSAVNWNCSCCFRFLCSQQRLSSIRSLFELTSKMYLLFQIDWRQSAKTALDSVALWAVQRIHVQLLQSRELWRLPCRTWRLASLHKYYP